MSQHPCKSFDVDVDWDLENKFQDLEANDITNVVVVMSHEVLGQRTPQEVVDWLVRLTPRLNNVRDVNFELCHDTPCLIRGILHVLRSWKGTLQAFCFMTFGTGVRGMMGTRERFETFFHELATCPRLQRYEGPNFEDVVLLGAPDDEPGVADADVWLNNSVLGSLNKVDTLQSVTLEGVQQIDRFAALCSETDANIPGSTHRNPLKLVISCSYRLSDPVLEAILGAKSRVDNLTIANWDQMDDAFATNIANFLRTNQQVTQLEIMRKMGSTGAAILAATKDNSVLDSLTLRFVLTDSDVDEHISCLLGSMQSMRSLKKLHLTMHFSSYSDKFRETTSSFLLQGLAQNKTVEDFMDLPKTRQWRTLCFSSFCGWMIIFSSIPLRQKSLVSMH